MAHDYTKPQIWDTIWSRPYKNYEKHHQFFWKKIRDRAHGRVADLGCGSASCWRIPHPLEIVDLIGFDFSLDGVEEAKKNCPWGHFFVKDIVDLEIPSECHDTVVLCGVVNYYHDLKPLLDEAFRIAAPGGEVIVTINVIDDFPNRHWDVDEIHKQFSPYGKPLSWFEEGIGWFIAITKK